MLEAENKKLEEKLKAVQKLVEVEKQKRAEPKKQILLNKSYTKDPNPVIFTEVTEFLKSIQLEKYYSKFTDNGIEDLDTILELND